MQEKSPNSCERGEVDSFRKDGPSWVDQQTAAMQVMQAHQVEIQKLMQE